MMKKLLIVSIVVLSMLLPMSAQAVSDTAQAAETVIEVNEPVYTDLSAQWYKASAEKFGYPEIFAKDGLFEPGKAITRMEFARTIHKALGISINYFAATDIGDYYSDVENTAVGASRLYDLVTAGIIDTKDRFRPDEPLSREEMIHFSINAVNYATGGNYAVILMMPAPFDDDALISEEYKNDVVLSVLLGLIKGRGANMLYPKESAGRAEAVVVIDRLIERIRALTEQVAVSSSYNVIDGALNLRLVIENNTSEKIKISHNSGQHYDFIVYDNLGESLYTWSADKLFITALTETEIEAGGTAEYTAVIEKDVYGNIKDKIAYIKAFITGSSDDFHIEAEGYTAELLPN